MSDVPQEKTPIPLSNKAQMLPGNASSDKDEVGKCALQIPASKGTLHQKLMMY